MNLVHLSLYLLLSSILISPIIALVDLEVNPSPFVVATKKIEIDGYPDAFNPTLFRWEGEIFLSFRIRDPISGSTNKFGIIVLDSQFNPVGSPQIFNVIYPLVDKPSCLQDPRICQVGGQLFVIFNNILYDSHSAVPKIEIRRVFVAELVSQNNGQRGSYFTLSEPVPLLYYPDEKPNKEKNWVPFSYKDKLLLAYSISPHRIVEPIFELNEGALIAETYSPITWKWGILRGGTQASLVVDRKGHLQYLAFFHSTTNVKSVHSKGAMIPHYFMGAYTFSPHPPFAITKISPTPIIGPNFYYGKDYSTWKPLRVVYPMGYIWDEEMIYLSYGRQDHEMWIAYIAKQPFLDSLIPLPKP